MSPELLSEFDSFPAYSTRRLSKALAPVVAELELNQPVVVTMDDLREILARVRSHTPPHVAAQRLRQQGWLLRTWRRGVWEFAPGAHAGAVGHGDPFLPLRAALAAHPVPGAAVALTSALWAHGLAPRAPERLEIAIAPEASVPATLRHAGRTVRFSASLEPTVVSGVPVHRLETVLVHMTARPGHVRSWGLIGEVLPDLVDEVDRDAVRTELAGRPSAVSARLAYLIQALDAELADELAVGRGKVWFGPRGPLRRHSQRFEVADTLLPFDPAELTPATR
jgi:predicted transcriptional regulator of viral defense system